MPLRLANVISAVFDWLKEIIRPSQIQSRREEWHSHPSQKHGRNLEKMYHNFLLDIKDVPILLLLQIMLKLITLYILYVCGHILYIQLVSQKCDWEESKPLYWSNWFSLLLLLLVQVSMIFHLNHYILILYLYDTFVIINKPIPVHYY